MLIRLAGLVAIEQDGTPAQALSSSQAQVAFARLVLERSGGTRRDQLADTIWPGGLPDTWASALRSVVSRVRAFLACSYTPETTVLVSQGGRYLLRLGHDVKVDLEQAEDAVAEAITAFAAGDFAGALRLADGATSCLHMPFLPEHEGEWVNGVRERMDELLVSGLETASLSASALGDERNALRFADEAVRRAPLRESAHRCRMSAHANAGNRAEALRCYHDLRRLLAEELGIDPAPKTQAAYVDLLGSPVSTPGRARRAPRQGTGTEAPFVGRKKELAMLAEAWSQAENGTSHLALITGESGVGKTRVATEAARRVSLAGGLVMYGRCDREAVVPYQPFVEALGGFLASTPEDSIPELNQATRETLARLIAEPEEQQSDAASPSSTPQRAGLLFALADLLVSVARDRPALLVLDDLDAADDDTLLLLRNLFRRRTGTSLLVIATAVTPMQRPDHFATALRGIDRGLWMLRIALRGLEEQDVRGLVHHILPETSASTVPAPHRLIADTAGNAYLLLELLRWHGEAGHGAARSGRGISSGIREYATARLAALDSAPRQLLRMAAVYGRSFELDLIAEAAELDPDHAMDSLDALVADGIVAEVITAGRRQHVHEYRFVHDILRQAIYEQFSEARRRQLHTRLADAIEQRRPDDLSSYSPTLANHRAAAAAPDGDQRAVRWVWRAAARAAQEQLPNEAVRLYQQALDHVPAEDRVLRAEALTNLGLAQYAAGHEHCEQTLLDGAIQGLHSGRPAIAAQAALGLADAVMSRPRLRSEAAALIDLLVQMAPRPSGERVGQGPQRPIDDVTLGRLLARQARLGAEVPSGITAGSALSALSRELRLLEGPDFIERRGTLAEEMLIVAKAIGDRNAIVVAAHHRAMAAEMAGDSQARKEALASLAAAVGEDDEEIDFCGDALLIDHAVATAVTQGRFTDAVATTRLAGSLGGGAAQHGIAPAPGSLAARQMHVAAWLHRSSWPTVNTGFSGVYGTAERSLTALLSGDRGWPHLMVRALARGTEPLPSGDEWPHVVGLLALGAVEIGDPTTADALRVMLAPYAKLTCGVGYRTFVGPATFHLGRLAIITGDWAEAERHLVSALSQLASRQARPWLALAQLALAQALEARARAGDRRSAEVLRAEAGRTLSSLGLRPRAHSA